MAEIKWIKIVTDVFDDEKILMIESMPEADSVIVIWFKLLCLAGKQNNSGVFLMGRMPYTDEMFSTIFRRPLNTVRMALKTFEQFGMIEIVNDTVTIPNWDKHQSLDSYEKKKERDRLYQAERRAKQKAIAEKSSDTSLDTSSDVAISDKSRKEKEKDIYITTTTTGEPPMLTEVYVYFKEMCDDDVASEAEKFHAYNSKRGWDCLPNWKATADLWIARIKDHS